jgi:hypothetical protein
MTVTSCSNQQGKCTRDGSMSQAATGIPAASNMGAVPGLVHRYPHGHKDGCATPASRVLLRQPCTHRQSKILPRTPLGVQIYAQKSTLQDPVIDMLPPLSTPHNEWSRGAQAQVGRQSHACGCTSPPSLLSPRPTLRTPLGVATPPPLLLQCQ